MTLFLIFFLLLSRFGSSALKFFQRRKVGPFLGNDEREKKVSLTFFQDFTKNVFVESDQQARVGAPPMVGVGQTRAGGGSAASQQRRWRGGFERRADATKPKPEKARDSLPEPPIATGRTERGSADARARSRDVHNDAERDEDRD